VRATVIRRGYRAAVPWRVRLPFVLLLLLASPALAWNTAGHMVSASIAFDVLKQDDPAAPTRVLDTLQKHPQYAERFADKLESYRRRNATAICSCSRRGGRTTCAAASNTTTGLGTM
jgi:hypothetical protein